MTFNSDKLVANIRHLIETCEERQVLSQRAIDEDDRGFIDETMDAMCRERDLLASFVTALRQVLEKSEDVTTETYSLRREK